MSRLDDLELSQHGGDGVLWVEGELLFLLPARLHDAQGVAEQDLGESLGGGRRKNGDARVGDVDQGEGADVIGVGVGEQDGVQRAAVLDLGEVGEPVCFSGTHANTGVDEDALAGDFEQGAGGADFVGAAQEGKLHSRTVLAERGRGPFVTDRVWRFKAWRSIQPPTFGEPRPECFA